MRTMLKLTATMLAVTAAMLAFPLANTWSLDAQCVVCSKTNNCEDGGCGSSCVSETHGLDFSQQADSQIATQP